ncbi:MAG: portal protein [Bacillota bacterium]
MDKKEKEDFLRIARDRFKKILTAEYDIRNAALEDLKFVYNVDNGQWPSLIRQEREEDNRPCLTSNKLRKYVAQVANRERDQRLAGRVRPVDDKADIQTAKIIEGMIRQIEYASIADEIYVNAGEQAIAGGFGYWRIVTEEADDSFDQEIFIRPIENQFSVYLDPRKNYAFIREGMSRDDFKFLYPDAEVMDFPLTGVGEDYSLWYEQDKVFIAEYFYKEVYEKTIAECFDIETGRIVILELTETLTPETLADNNFKIIRQEIKKAKRVKWAKITGNDVLEEGIWVGKEIPIIEVLGDKINIEGKQYKRSLIRDGKDPQRTYNFWLTHMTETVALTPKSPYIVTPQEIKGFEKMWNEANKKNYPYLLYNPQGNRIPERQIPSQIPTGAAQMLQISAGDIQDTIGMYDASFGERSNERTGIAIRSRAQRSDFGTYHFPDNFRRAIIETTRQLIYIIPKIYDTERQIRILGEEGIEDIVTINKVVLDIATGRKIIYNDITVGKYDVVADVRIFSTRRQEAAEMMTTTMQAAPNIAPLIMDLIFQYNDWPGAEEIAKRIKQFLPALLGIKTPEGETTPPIATIGG